MRMVNYKSLIGKWKKKYGENGMVI